jgi:transposase
MEPFYLGKGSNPGQTGHVSRLFMEAVLWVVRSGEQRHELPGEFGKLYSVFMRFRRWMKEEFLLYIQNFILIRRTGIRDG